MEKVEQMELAVLWRASLLKRLEIAAVGFDEAAAKDQSEEDRVFCTGAAFGLRAFASGVRDAVGES